MGFIPSKSLIRLYKGRRTGLWHPALGHDKSDRLWVPALPSMNQKMLGKSLSFWFLSFVKRSLFWGLRANQTVINSEALNTAHGNSKSSILSPGKGKPAINLKPTAGGKRGSLDSSWGPGVEKTANQVPVTSWAAWGTEMLAYLPTSALDQSQETGSIQGSLFHLYRLSGGQLWSNLLAWHSAKYKSF